MATLESFLSDVSKHQMTVLRSDGLYRHLRFKAPGTMDMSFDVLTWPGHLCYTGDMGTFVFQRLPDMFNFFRIADEREPNFHYWAQKVEAEDKFSGLREWDADGFRESVMGDVTDYIEAKELNESDAQDLRDAVGDSIDFDDEYGALRAVQDFEYEGFSFSDVEPCYKLTDRFIWCCYALGWAVKQWDAQCPK